MLAAMNTGHDGSLSTGHANSTMDMLSRLETMILSSSAIPLEAVRKQIASAIDIIIFLSRLRDKSRRTLEISEVLGLEKGQYKLNPLFSFEEAHQNNIGLTDRVTGCLARSANPLVNTQKLTNAGLLCDI